MNQYELLISRLDAFIRRFYTNKLIRGTLIFLAAALAFYLLASVGEYYFYFPSWMRYLLLALFVGVGGFALIALILIPLLQSRKLGKVISHEKAAQIVGQHFPEVQDKLLNVLQLRSKVSEHGQSQLLIASIEQKTKELSPIPFQKAVNYAKNKKYLTYVLPPLLIGLFILLASPDILVQSSKRFLAPSKTFVPPPPFNIVLQSGQLKVPQFEDVVVTASTEGKSVPEQLFVAYNGQTVMMQKKGKNQFSHTFFKVAKSFSFHFEAAGVRSPTYAVQTLYKPLIKQFRVAVDYPDYTGRKDEMLDNIGDIIAPQGTTLRWIFQTEHTDLMEFQLGQGSPVKMPAQMNQFVYSYKFMRDTSYKILFSNRDINRKDTLQYHVSVIPDQYPSINVQQYNDTLTDNYVLFVGEAGDDYGVRIVSLHFTIQKTDANGAPAGAPRHGSLPVPITAGTMTQFNQFLDIETLDLQAGDQLSYYFSACDNDAVNGSKCAKSVTFTYEKPSLKKLDSLVEKTQEQVNKDLNNASKQNDKIEKEIKEMQEKLLQKNELDWQDKKNLEQMMERNENLQKQIDQVAKKFEENNRKSEQKNYSDEIKDKQDNMEKLLEELKNNQMAERMKKMEELMKMLNKDQLFDQLKQMQQDNALMEKDLDRMLELMKQLERDMRLEDLAKKAEDLAKKEDALNKETDAKSKSEQELKAQQDKLNQEMEELKKDMKEMEKVNEEMENKTDLKDIKKEQENAEQEMNKSSDELNKKNSSKASKSQKNAKESLEKMAQKMADAAAGGGPEELEEDVRAVRQILSNLIRMSFNQEDLMADTRKTAISDPQYVGNIQVQQKIKTDAKLIADSLFKLSKRQARMASSVNKEIDAINRNMESAIQQMEGRSVNQATMHQQYVMTGANNLALMLNEMLQSLMDQQAQQKNGSPGSGNCSKPGGKSPSGKMGKKGGQGIGMQLGDIITKQQQLGNAMQQLMDKKGQQGKGGKDGKDGGQKPGGQKPGGQQGGGQGGGSGQGGQGSESEQSGGESEQMARIAAQQAALRKQLNDINNQLKKEGKSHPNLTKIQQDMDRNETDIVNKRITQQLLQRQSEILSRLLETKEALREQDQGKERESNSGKETTKEIPPALREILKNKQSVIDYYKTVPAELKPYYKKMVEDYYLLIK